MTYLKNPFKEKGFQQLVIKGAISATIIFLVQIIIGRYFSKMAFFQTYLFTPDSFQLLPSINRIIFINAIIFGCVAFFIFSYKRLLKIKSFKLEIKQLYLAILPIFFFCTHYLLKFIINRNLEFFLEAPVFWGIIKLILNILFAISVFISIYGLEFTKYFIKYFKKEIIIFSLITLAFFFIMLLFQNLWRLFSDIISRILYHIFNIFFDNVYYRPSTVNFNSNEGLGPVLGINDFRASIGKQCSGIDSLLLFTSLYALIFILDYKRLKKGLAITLFFVGALGMFLTNAFRILLLFIVGAYIDAQFAIGMFHTNAGWIMFIGYFFVYWWIVSRFIYKDIQKSKK